MVTKKKVFLTSKELMERYGVVLRTIQNWQRTKGFPIGDFFSKTYRWLEDLVIGWEKIHMPHLHAASVVDDEPAERTAEWSERVKERARDRDSGKGDKNPAPAKKAKRSTGRKPR